MMRRLIGILKKAGVPIYLNVYDLTPINGVLHCFGLGIYLSAIEAHGVEYAFGAHDYSSSGVFEVEPRRCPGFRFRESIQLGTIELDSKELRQFMVQMSSEYNGDTYNLLAKNCNHFCNDVSVRLTGIPIPAWVNRLATLGTLCSCLLLYSPAIRYPREFQGHKRGCKSKECKGCIHVTDSLTIASSRIQQHPFHERWKRIKTDVMDLVFKMCALILGTVMIWSHLRLEGKTFGCCLQLKSCFINLLKHYHMKLMVSFFRQPPSSSLQAMDTISFVDHSLDHSAV